MHTISQSQRDMAEALPSMIWTATPDGNVDFVNHVFETYTGELADQGGVIDWLNVIHPADREPATRVWANSIANGSFYQTEFRIIHKPSNTYRWHHVAARPHRDEAGNIVRWYGISTDIHETRLAQETLAQAHLDLRHMLALQTLEARVLDKISADHSLLSIMDEITHTVDELIPGVCSSILLLDNDTLRHGSAPKLPGAYNVRIDGMTIGEGVGSCGTAAARKQPVVVTDIHTDPLWTTYPELIELLGMRACWSTPVLSTDNTVLATFGMYHHEPAAPTEDDLALIDRVCQFVRVAIERTRYRNEAQANEARFRAIAQASGDVIWEYQPTTDEIWFSDGLLRVFGHKPGSTLGALVTRHIHPEDRDRVAAAMREAKAHGTAWTLEYRYQCADGSYANVVSRAAVLRDAAGTPERIVGTITDVTEQKKLEERLHHTQRLESVSHLTGGLAHDFNNLLTIILGNAGQLVDDLAPGSEQQEMARIMQTAARKGADLIRSLLAFSRQQMLDAKPVHVNDLVAGMQALLHRALGTHFELKVELAAEPWGAFIDPSQLESALLNLTANARDAMSGKGALAIRTRNTVLDGSNTGQPAATGEYVVVEVCDTGTGIDPANIRRIFDPYFTTKAFGAGSGLGLSMVYGFVQQSNGFIEVTSQPGQGTCIQLFFPRHVHIPATPAPEAAPAPLQHGQGTVLVVEDEPMVQTMIVGQLTRLGYSVVAASTGPEGLEQLKTRPDIDLLFTDMMMPGGLDGYQLAEMARQENPDIRVILSSGYSDRLAGARERTPEGYWILTKPYIRAQLATVLGNAFSIPSSHD